MKENNEEDEEERKGTRGEADGEEGNWKKMGRSKRKRREIGYDDLESDSETANATVAMRPQSRSVYLGDASHGELQIIYFPVLVRFGRERKGERKGYRRQREVRGCGSGRVLWRW